tara:strand:+ start:65 stop:880 length:816 start_codon:yes stop_codon:yes gene_type:complete
MKKNNSNRDYFKMWISTILFNFLLFYVIFAYHEKTYDASHINNESFVLVSVTSHIDLAMCEMVAGENCGFSPANRSTSARGSGFVVSHSKSKTYIVTAEHVCNFKIEKPPTLSNIVYNFVSINKVKLTDFNGNIYSANIKYADKKNDICILESDGIWGSATPTANEMPRHGERVYNIAAPYGIFYPGMALTFDGYYSGTDQWGNEVYTLPTRPGSSGSAIFNSAGELVSIIHSSTMALENIGIGCKLKNLKSAISSYADEPMDNYLFFLRR